MECCFAVVAAEAAVAAVAAAAKAVAVAEKFKRAKNLPEVGKIFDM